MEISTVLRRITAVAVAAAMVLASSGNVWSAEKAAKKAKPPKPPVKAEVHGRVFAADAKTPVAGATIHFRWLEGGDVIDSKPTDKNGRFQIKGLDYGWAEIAVETPKGTFVSDQVLEVLPGAKASMDFNITRFDERSADYWVARAASGAEPGSDAGAAGLAESRTVLAGKDFWKSPKGIAIIAGTAGGVLLLIAVTSKKTPTAATTVPITPTTP